MKKRWFGMMALAALVMALTLTGCGGGDTRVLNVYNWGTYLADGTDGTMNVLESFEDWYEQTYGEKIRVSYSTFASNEDLYNKLSIGAVSYDLIIPSDYMVSRMREEDMLRPLNFENIPNYQYIGEDFHGLYYDPEDAYSIPYAYGMVGVIYDANVVDPADAGTWDLMWNDKYADRILQYNNPRDAFGTAMYRLGIDVNTQDPAQWEQAFQALEQQQPLVKSYVMDEIFNLMQSGEASIASFYVGDYFLMQADQAESVDLRFYYPEHTNFFVDAMCIPKTAAEPELAEIFMNYLLSEEIALANARYIYCPVPNRLVYENEDYIREMGPEAMEIMYPQVGSFFEQYNRHAYRNLNREQLDCLNTLWETLKIK